MIVDLGESQPLTDKLSKNLADILATIKRLHLRLYFEKLITFEILEIIDFRPNSFIQLRQVFLGKYQLGDSFNFCISLVYFIGLQ